MPSIQEITRYLEQFAPISYQADYDNSGLIIGDPQTEVTGILISLDAIEVIVEEAIAKGCNLIIAHHPIIFKGLKKLNGKNYIEKTVLKAIKNDIAIYAIHTNLDNVQGGVNTKIAQKLGLEDIKVLSPLPQTLMKLSTFVPKKDTQSVLKALGEAGAGQIGEYKNCSFRVEGIGTFEPSEQANPHIGQANQLEEVAEDRIEVVFPKHLQGAIFNALQTAHPYEEVAYYLHTLENKNQEIGSGAIGKLPQPMLEKDFLAYLKEKMQVSVVRHTHFTGQKVETVAVCGGVGSFLLGKAIQQKAQVFVSADFKYHEFFDAEQKIMIADIGHYESEQFTKDLLRELLEKKFTSLKLSLCESNTNPIHYYY